MKAAIDTNNSIRFPEGLGCYFHDNCFTCPIPNPDKCRWNSDNSKSRYIVVDTETHRKLVFGEESKYPCAKSTGR